MSDSSPVPGTWVSIPADTFMMGSPTDEPCRDTQGEDLHEVTLKRSFEISSTEVTQAEFAALMEYNPSHFGPNGSGADCGTDCPVEMVSWHEAVAYCNALSAQAALTLCYKCNGVKEAVTCDVDPAYAGVKIYACTGYRLPTDAEWEYAYRARTQTAYYNGDNAPTACRCQGDANLDAIAWYCGRDGLTTHPVRQKGANDWQLYDMAGNVYEWCHDWYTASLGTGVVSDPWGLASATSRVLRGGCYQKDAKFARAAKRNGSKPGSRNAFSGFRCVRTM